MAVVLAPVGDARPQFFTSAGLVLNGGLIYFYAAGTSTLQNTFTDSTGVTANANPVVLDAAGRAANGIWFTQGLAYKIIAKDSAGVTLWTEDNVRGMNDVSVTQDEWVASGLTPTYVSATSFTLTGDQTVAFHKGRRLKTTNSGGTIYSVITQSAYSSTTTVTVENDSGTLDSGLSAASYGLLSAVGTSVPSLKDTNAVITGSVDQTKRVVFEADNLTTATKRTITVQDKDATLPALEDVVGTWNLTLSCSVSSNALTIAIKTRAGNDPSAGDPVFVAFRNVTAATGDYAVLKLVAATSLVLSNGSTLGTTANIANRIWIVGFNDGGTFRVGAINCIASAAGGGAGRVVTSYYPLQGWGIASSTAEGGAGAADSSQTIYTGTAVTSKAYTVLGYLTYETGLATAGVYASAPTRVQLYGPSVPLPGQIVNMAESLDAASSTGLTGIPHDDTIPQITEGTQSMSLAVTPTSAANILEWDHVGNYADSAADLIQVAFFQDATANALAVTRQMNSNVNTGYSMFLRYPMLASTTSSTTGRIRFGDTSANTITFNGASGGRKYGGTLYSSLRATERMG